MNGSPRWRRRPDGSNWGDFGPDDQRGRLNLLTPERVKRAVQEVTEGLTFCLSLPLDYPGGQLAPMRPPPRLFPTLWEGRPFMNYPYRLLDPQYTDVVCDDMVVLCLQYSTQWDSLAHMGSLFDADGDGVAEMRYYNGYRGGEDVRGPYDYEKDAATGVEGSYAHALGIQNMAETCVQGRGVLIDLQKHCGLNSRPVGYDELMRILHADRIEVEEGDMVCLRTGYDRLLLGINRSPVLAMLQRSSVGLDGCDEKLLQWITDSGLAVLISDNVAVEYVYGWAVPVDGPLDHPRAGSAHGPYAKSSLHEHCLFKLGIHLGEMFLLSDLADWLAAHDRYRFLLTAPPLRLPGAVGSPPAPVATV